MPMDTTAYRAKVAEIRNALVAMDRDLVVPHIALLFNAMYSDEFKDDSYQRLQYLALWQSLAEAGAKHLNYQGKKHSGGQKSSGGQEDLAGAQGPTETTSLIGGQMPLMGTSWQTFSER